LIEAKKILSDLQRVTQELSIPITDNCNLRCSYCHASAGEEHKTETMTESMIDAILDCYFNNISEHTEKVKINFTGGGEPTYKLDKLSYAIKKANDLSSQRNIKCSFHMATNGCYGQKIREFITNNFSEVSLSFDGPAHIQNLHRPVANGQPSFDLVYETAKYFYQKKFSFALRSTISDYSLNYLTNIIDFFESNFPDVHVGLEPLILVGRALKNSQVGPPDAKKFGDELIGIFKYTKKKRIQIANSASSEYDIIRPVFCSGVGVPNWTISMNGDIVCCSRDGAPEEFTFGRLDYKDSKIVIDKEKLNNIRKMNVFSYEECKDCFAKYHCAGDCPDRRLSNKSDCASIKKIGKYILNERINA
jgi:radical SAM protein with 4Fe4S-binding SPASM domain